MRLGPGRSERLLIVIHHLVVDGVSWRILLEDLQRLYRDKEQSLPVKSSSYKQWAECLRQYAGSEELRKELDFWQGTVGRGRRGKSEERREARNRVEDERTVSMWLDEEQTQALLQDVPGVYRTQITEVLLTALVRGWEKWRGESHLLLDLEGHGREELFEDLDVTRTVGWFTSVYSVALELKGGVGAGDALKSVKEQMRSIPRKGIGYGILKYLGGEETRNSLKGLDAEVGFNYLGQFDQVVEEESIFGLGREGAGPSRSRRQRRAHEIEVNGSVMGGRLRLGIGYSERLHRREEVEELGAAVTEALRELIEHCQSPEAGGYTPSDFLGVELEQEELDNLISEFEETPSPY
jgi:non-ribosomal peptide synthase protein (TIGR01720 family)